MNFDFPSLIAGFIFGTFGWYLLKHARKKGDTVGIIIGLALMIYPYFVENIYLTWGIGAVLLFLAYRKPSY